jgi:hypothetical protein
MKTTILATVLICTTAIAGRAAEDKVAPSQADQELGRQIGRLVGRLDDDRAVEREAAEKELFELAGKTSIQSNHFLELLPKENDQMPLAVRDRLARIRQQIEERVAKAATAGTTVTLSAKGMPLADVFAAIEKQTGNRLKDNTEADADQNAPKAVRINMDLKDQPFWSALDQILDQAKLGVYSYGGEDALTIVSRDQADGARVGRAQYDGPFRIDVLEVQAQRGLRQPKQQSLKLQLEVAWEPRLRPIAITQPIADVAAKTDAGGQLTVQQPEAVLDVEVPNGTQAAEITLPFDLPLRDVKKISALHGKLRALVPGQRVKFQFDDLAKAAGKTQRRGGVQVTLDEVRKNNEVWEVHMRFSLDEANNALQSHRNWVTQNISYLVGKDGKPIENAGLETTSQTENEVGIAYLFDVPGGIEGLSWVYETPAAIVELPVEYEIKEIELP